MLIYDIITYKVEVNVVNGIVIDLSIILILILFGLIGYFKGFLRGILSFCGFIGAGLIAYYTRNYFVGVLNDIFNWGLKISDFLMKQIAGINSLLVSKTFSDSASMIDFINSSEINVFYKKVFQKMASEASFLDGPISVGQMASEILSNLIMQVIAVIAVFIVIRIVVAILNKLLKRIPRKNALGQVDMNLGVFVGLAKGVITIAVILVIFNVVCMIPSVSEKLMPVVDSTCITKGLLNVINQYVLKS